MDYYKTVKRYYDKGYYTIDQVAVFVEAGKITEAQFEDITGMSYTDYKESILAASVASLAMRGIFVDELL